MRAAEATLVEQSYVSPIDVLVGVGSLTPQAVDQWRHMKLSTVAKSLGRPWP